MLFVSWKWEEEHTRLANKDEAKLDRADNFHNAYVRIGR